MTDLEQAQTLNQFVNNIEISALRLEKAYNEKDIEGFNKNKQEILNIQKRISEMIKQSLLKKDFT